MKVRSAENGDEYASGERKALHVVDSRWIYTVCTIDRIVPLLKELAANTTAAINHVNQNRTRPTTPDYAEYLRANAETAHQLSDIISNFVQYGETRAKLNRLEQKIEIASK